MKVLDGTIPIPIRTLALGALTLVLANRPASADILSTGGDVQLVSPPSFPLAQDAWESDTYIRVFTERQGEVLRADLEVDVALPGTYGPDATGTYVIPKGSRVNSYFLHFDRVGSSGYLYLEGHVWFEEPVLGIIVSDERLYASDDALGADVTTYPPGLAYRGLELDPPGVYDSVSFSRRKMDVSLSSSIYLDHVRVITGYGLAFSTDIGSDTEFSDPASDADELLDPGDLYLSGLFAEASTFWDDQDFLDVTHPDAPDPVPYFGGTCLPPGSKTFFTENFDLDAFDSIGLDLKEHPERPIYWANLGESERLGILELSTSPFSFLISFDDDSRMSWPACGDDLPVDSRSHIGRTYGSAGNRDEVLALVIAGAGFPRSMDACFGYLDETGVHSALAPDPEDGNQLDDDDVDALDWLGLGRRILFSCDHEGLGGFIDPVGGGVVHLDPGTIYGMSAGVPVPLITPDQLGIHPPTIGVDLDAFEICAMEEPSSGVMLLAVVFSVDSDDPWTLDADESGGLDPNVVYASFMNGFHHELIVDLDDDVDAIAACPVPELLPGTAYCFGNALEGNPCPCGNDNDHSTPLGGCAHSDAAAGARLDASGRATVGASTVVLHGTRGPASNFGIFFQAQVDLDGSGLFIGDGLRCTGGSLKRLEVVSTNELGNASTSVDIWQRSSSLGDVIGAGETRYYQWWFRDPDGPCGTGSNTSNGYMITWQA